MAPSYTFPEELGFFFCRTTRDIAFSYCLLYFCWLCDNNMVTESYCSVCFIYRCNVLFLDENWELYFAHRTLTWKNRRTCRQPFYVMLRFYYQESKRDWNCGLDRRVIVVIASILIGTWGLSIVLIIENVLTVKKFSTINMITFNRNYYLSSYQINCIVTKRSMSHLIMPPNRGDLNKSWMRKMPCCAAFSCEVSTQWTKKKYIIGVQLSLKSWSSSILIEKIIATISMLLRNRAHRLKIRIRLRFNRELYLNNLIGTYFIISKQAMRSWRIASSEIRLTWP